MTGGLLCRALRINRGHFAREMLLAPNGLIVLAYRNRLIGDVVQVFQKLISQGFRVDSNLISRGIASLQK